MVIGETSIIGRNVKIYQGTTLGALSFRRDERGRIIKGGKRHPTIGDRVIVSSGAKVLGPFKVGNDVKIGAGSVVLKEVPDGCTVVGVPGIIVKRPGQHTEEMNQIDLPDPTTVEMECLRRRIVMLEQKVKELENENIQHSDEK